MPDSEKHQVEIEYGLAPKGYGSTNEIDHIASLELGGSKDIANLCRPRAGSGARCPLRGRGTYVTLRAREDPPSEQAARMLRGNLLSPSGAVGLRR